MKKKLILFISFIAIICGILFILHKKNTPSIPNQEWYEIQDITFDQKDRKISGTCITHYKGEIEVYLPDTIDTSSLKNGQDIKALAGPGMTMSLPPQLMNCTKIEILDE